MTDEEVVGLLEPISAAKPSGDDLSVSGDPSYHKLRMAMTAPSIDADVCVGLAKEILRTKSKDLQVGVWLCFAWYRAAKLAGLRRGFQLLLGLLTTFGDKLFPADPSRRSKVFSFLANQKPLARMLAKEPLTQENGPDVKLLQEIFPLLQAEYQKQFGGEQQLLKEVGAILAGYQTPSVDATKAAPGRTAADHPVPPTPPPPSKPVVEPTPDPVRAVSVSGEDPLTTVRKLLLLLFEEPTGAKKTKVPEEPVVYGVIRQLLWGRILLTPAEKASVTEIEGPAKQKQDFVRKLHADARWDDLVCEIEIQFLNQPGFRYWLDAQRFAVQALEEKGNGPAAAEVKHHLARLVDRFPGLPGLKFKDRVTPFADSETERWLDAEIRGGASKAAAFILPPIMGEDFEPLRREYEEACTALPASFPERAGEMQKAIRADDRRKGKFLRTLNLANYCLAAKRHDLAKAFLEELRSRIEEYGLQEWEPALCTAVWESLYMLNARLIGPPGAASKHPELVKDQERLIALIGRYDCVRALALADKQHH